MTSQESARVHAGKRWPAAGQISAHLNATPGQPGSIELSPELRAELLDPEGWREVLETYARTMRLGVALTDSAGCVLGTCHNAQPIWSLARDTKPERGAGCSFCLAPRVPCTAVVDALRTRRTVMARDSCGLAHLAIPLALDDRYLGALIAGQVFDRYPEPLPLQRVAREFGVSEQGLWQLAIRQHPISRATLEVYGELLWALGQAFLHQRYGAIVERKLAETNQRFRLLVDGVKDYALFTVNAAGCVTSWNLGAERLLGYKEAEIVGQDFSQVFTPEDVQAGAPAKELQKAMQEGRAQSEGWRVRKDGTRFLASGVLSEVTDGGLREFGKIMHDITERRNTEEALLEAQKLESIGVLAGGIAHDFNNLLAGILGNASLLLEGSSALDPRREGIEDIVACGQRAMDLTNQLLAYAGKGRFVITRFDLSHLISEILHLIQTSIPKKVELQLALDPALPWIEADESQIQQIVMNLVINGAEAIGAEAGKVRVSTGVIDIAVWEARAGEEMKPGRFVYMEVQDSGCGMDDATRAKIFDPFFTTKFLGRGLGLSAVSGIVRRHKGRMQVESVPGEGSTFKVFLPALEAHLVRTESAAAPIDRRGTGTILVVDDEEVVRRLAKAMLEHCGYAVLAAGDGREAVDIFRENASDITAVLLDMTMPVMDGQEALQQIRNIRPNVPIIISSGYSEFVAREHFVPSAVTGFIQKPYTVAKLAEQIRTILQD